MSRFATAVRTAIESSSLSLEEVAGRLKERGASVSPSSLSAWQSGLSVPRRASSLAALGQLEALLELVPGSLAGLLPTTIRRGRAPRLTADDVWDNPAALARVLSRLEAKADDPTEPEKLSQRLTLRMNELGHMQSLTLATLIRSRRDGTHRIISISSDEEIQDAPRIVTARGARVGRFKADPATGYSAYEVLLPTPIDAGQLALVEYTEYFHPRVDAQDLTILMTPGALDAVLTVEFHPERLPASCTASFRPSAHVAPTTLVTFEPGRPWVRLTRAAPEPGIYGIGWSWS